MTEPTAIVPHAAQDDAPIEADLAQRLASLRQMARRALDPAARAFARAELRRLGAA